MESQIAKKAKIHIGPSNSQGLTGKYPGKKTRSHILSPRPLPEGREPSFQASGATRRGLSSRSNSTDILDFPQGYYRRHKMPLARCMYS